MLEMRRVTGKAREMRDQRAGLVAELRAQLADDDVTHALLARATSTAEEIFAHEIQKHTPKVGWLQLDLRFPNFIYFTIKKGPRKGVLSKHTWLES